MKKITVSFVLLFLGLFFICPVFAGQKARTLEDKIISSTFKTLVKAYVAASDIEKLKQRGVDKINRMDEQKFHKRYAEAYEAVKDLPEDLKIEYAITEHKTKKEAIKDIKALNKNKIYKAINAVPNTVIADNFRKYLAKKREELQKSNLAEQINKIWNKIIQKMEKDKPKSG